MPVNRANRLLPDGAPVSQTGHRPKDGHYSRSWLSRKPAHMPALETNACSSGPSHNSNAVENTFFGALGNRADRRVVAGDVLISYCKEMTYTHSSGLIGEGS